MAEPSIIAKFGADTSPLRSGIAQAKGMVGGFVAEIAALASVSVFIGLAKQAIDLGSNLADTSKQLGIHVERLQALQYAAIGAGVKQEELAASLKRTRIFAEEAAQGGQKQLEVLRQLNINNDKFFKAPLDKKLELIGQAFKSSKDQGQAFNAVAEIFGAKVGPQMTTLLVEAAKGMDGLTKEAKKAGAVMSAETIAALDTAGDRIEEFKRKATVAVGNIIVNFRTEEGLKLMLFQFLGIAGRFGAKIVDALEEAKNFAAAGFAAAFVYVANLFRDKMLDAGIAVASFLNKVLPAKFGGIDFDIKAMEKMKSAGKSIAELFAIAISGTKPAEFSKTVGEFWDKAVADQQKVVDNLNKVNFKTEVKSLTTAAEKAGQNINDASKNLDSSADKMGAASEKIGEASARLGEELTRTGQLSPRDILDKDGQKIGQTGNGFFGFGNAADRMNASDEELQELIRRSRKSEKDSRNFALNPKDISGLAGALNGAWFSTIALEAEQELERRMKLRSDLSRGENFARQQFNGDPLQFDELVQQYTKGVDEARLQTQILKRIDDKLSNYGTNT